MDENGCNKLSQHLSVFAAFVGFLYARFSGPYSMSCSEMKVVGRVSLLAAQGDEGTWEKQRSIPLKSRCVRLTLRIFVESPHQLQGACKRVFIW